MDYNLSSWHVLSTETLIDTLIESNRNNERFCFILGSGASVESGIPTGATLEEKWMGCLMGESFDDDTPPKNPEEVRYYAENLRNDGRLSFDFSIIENKWEKVKSGNGALPSEYYFDLYTLRFYPNYQNAYRYLERLMESVEPSLGYRILAELLTYNNKNNLVITTNFDTLIEDALFLYTDKKPLVINHELLADYISNPALSRPIIAKIHRGLFFSPLNTNEDTNKIKKEWREALSSVFQIYTPIVIGYGGGDHSLMDFFQDESVKMRRGIYWCYIPKYGMPNKRIRDLVELKKGYFVSIEGFDAFMMSIGCKLFPEQITPHETNDLLLQRCYSRMEHYSENWDKLHMKCQDAEAEDNKSVSTIMEAVSKEGISEFDYLNKAKESYKNKDYEAAIDLYDKAINMNNKYAPAYNGRGASYSIKGRYKEAITDLDKAIELNPNYAAAYNNRGRTYQRMKQYDKSLSDYNKSIELNPNLSQLYYNRGCFFNIQQRYENALSDLNKAIELNLNISKVYLNRGIANAGLQLYENAAQDYLKAIELDPNDSMSYNNLADVYYRLAQHQNSLKYADKAIELKTDYSIAYITRGEINHALEKFSEAINDFSKAIDLDPENPETYNKRALSYEAIGDKEMAKKDRSKAKELAKNELPDEN